MFTPTVYLYTQISTPTSEPLSIKTTSASVAASVTPVPGIKPTAAEKGIVSGKYYKISAKHSGKVMDVLLNGMNNGVKVVQYAFNGGTNQMWKAEEVESGYYKLTARSSGKCLSIKDNGLNNGAELIQSDYTGERIKNSV